jgi:dienelactone hydrolase
VNVNEPSARAASRSSRVVDAVFAVLGAVALLVSALALHRMTAGIVVETANVEGTPLTIYRPSPSSPRAPVVVIAHGFAGSQQLMQPFATTFAQNGYVAVTFDFRGHGRNARPLDGSITEETGATRTLVAQTGAVAAFARGLGDGRLAVLGHSMASDIVVRFAKETPGVAATVAVSMFSPSVTATEPRNLLVVVGAWEGFLEAEARRAVALGAGTATPEERVTYGAHDLGTARRMAFSPGAEHIGVLYSKDAMAEALAWLDATFGTPPRPSTYLDRRGPFVLLLLAGIVLLGRPLARWLPVVSPRPIGAGLGWRALWPCLVLPMIGTPLVLRVLPTHFLPILVGDYLAVHFLVYGLLTAACLRWRGSREAAPVLRPWRTMAVRPLGAALLVAFWVLAVLGFAIDRHATSFAASWARLPLILAMFVGTISFFSSDEWLTRGPGAARGGYVVSKLAFLFSLALAVGLDFTRLFFLVIIVPIMMLFFLVYGAFSTWVYRRTGHPLVAALANALAFAWALGVTFPLLAA